MVRAKYLPFFSGLFKTTKSSLNSVLRSVKLLVVEHKVNFFIVSILLYATPALVLLYCVFLYFFLLLKSEMLSNFISTFFYFFQYCLGKDVPATDKCIRMKKSTFSIFTYTLDFDYIICKQANF